MEGWLRPGSATTSPMTSIVRESAHGHDPGFNQTQRGRPAFDQGANVFYQVNEFKAENIAASTSRLFLGVKLECAQCHDHPFARWSRKQFWELAAFFTEVQPQPGIRRVGPQQDQPKIESGKREIKIPGTEKVVQARFLDGKEPNLAADPSSRKVLADWMTSTGNPFFARAVVNRYWAHFFGVGIAEPVDELENEDNPPSHPELLDELAAAFAQHGHDPKFLIRAITSSKTYQLTSASRSPAKDDLRAFNRMALKGLTAEQLFDSLCQATGFRDNPQNPQFRGFNQPGTPRAEFLARFDNSADKKTEHQTSILQALALMNGKFIADVTSLERSMTLQGIVSSPFMDNKQKLETLFLATLSRPMKPHEASKLVRYVEEGGPSKDPNKALADVFWVLLNSGEFSCNH